MFKNSHNFKSILLIWDDGGWLHYHLSDTNWSTSYPLNVKSSDHRGSILQNPIKLILPEEFIGSVRVWDECQDTHELLFEQGMW